MPKKGKGKKKKEEKDPNALSEVDKTFYELTITDLNRKLARLRTLTHELEEKNEELRQELSKSNQDSDDIIIYLKKIQSEKSDEIAELRDGLQSLEETHIRETKEFLQKIADMDEEYRQMHETLNSEMKLLEGKLNALEEFRIQREELMKKYEKQERDMEEQEIRHKRELYEIERKFIISKNLLMKEMEAKLQKLSTEFQSATETRIAATTHRMIRENIAINNELDTMLETHQRLTDENLELKKNAKTAKNESELFQQENKKVMGKFRVQQRIIERLTKEHEEMSDKLRKNKFNEKVLADTRKELEDTCNANKFLEKKVYLLEQNLHASRCENFDLKNEIEYIKETSLRTKLTQGRVIMAIKEALDIEAVPIRDESLRQAKRQDLLNNLLDLLTEEYKPHKPSLESICGAREAAEAVYAKGDLGFVPKLVPKPKTKFPVRRHIGTRMGPSFELLAAEAPKMRVRRVEEFKGEEEEEVIEEVTPPKSTSMILEEAEEESTPSMPSVVLREEEEESSEELEPAPAAVEEAETTEIEEIPAEAGAVEAAVPVSEGEEVGEEETREKVEGEEQGEEAAVEEQQEEEDKVPETEETTDT